VGSTRTRKTPLWAYVVGLLLRLGWFTVTAHGVLQVLINVVFVLGVPALFPVLFGWLGIADEQKLYASPYYWGLVGLWTLGHFARSARDRFDEQRARADQLQAKLDESSQLTATGVKAAALDDFRARLDRVLEEAHSAPESISLAECLDWLARARTCFRGVIKAVVYHELFQDCADGMNRLAARLIGDAYLPGPMFREESHKDRLTCAAKKLYDLSVGLTVNDVLDVEPTIDVVSSGHA